MEGVWKFGQAYEAGLDNRDTFATLCGLSFNKTRRKGCRLGRGYILASTYCSEGIL